MFIYFPHTTTRHVVVISVFFFFFCFVDPVIMHKDHRLQNMFKNVSSECHPNIFNTPSYVLLINTHRSIEMWTGKLVLSLLGPHRYFMLMARSLKSYVDCHLLLGLVLIFENFFFIYKPFILNNMEWTYFKLCLCYCLRPHFETGSNRMGYVAEKIHIRHMGRWSSLRGSDKFPR